MTARPGLGRFIGAVFLCLLPCFGLWALLSPLLVQPVIGLVHLLLSNWLPDTVAAVQVDVSRALVVTQFDRIGGELVPAQSNGEHLTLQQDTRILSYSLPFYTALHLATHRGNRLGDYGWGILWLYLILLLGVIGVALKDLLLNLGPQFLAQNAPLQPPPTVIALFYQLSVLIMPTLGPVALWAWQARHEPLLRVLLPASGPPA
jgi:hypothetical protein